MASLAWAIEHEALLHHSHQSVAVVTVSRYDSSPGFDVKVVELFPKYGESLKLAQSLCPSHVSAILYWTMGICTYTSQCTNPARTSPGAEHVFAIHSINVVDCFCWYRFASVMVEIERHSIRGSKPTSMTIDQQTQAISCQKKRQGVPWQVHRWHS